MPKFKVGDFVGFKSGEHVLNAPDRRFKRSLKGYIGRIKEVELVYVKRIFGIKDESFRYAVEVRIDGVPYAVVAEENELSAVSLDDFVQGLYDGTMKRAEIIVKNGDTETIYRENGIFQKRDGKVFNVVTGEFVDENYESNADKIIKAFFEASDKILDDILKGKKKPLTFVDIDSINVGERLRRASFDAKIDMKRTFPSLNTHTSFAPEHKMSKDKCIKLLESYRAEREKVKKGRRFERCLRDSVVDEALERAIELLKGGGE